MDLETRLDEALQVLSTETQDLLGYVDVIDSTPEPLNFYRNWVSQNRPLVINNAFDHWPAHSKWSEKYFRENIGELAVTVAVTPNGYADAINGDYFVMPEERQMTMNSFLDVLFPSDKAEDKGIYYIQKQNSNLHDEFSSIMKDVEPFEWANKAFGNEADAVNFWMGDQRAVTSLHRDHYENLYCVISGQKDFILLPPSDLPYMPYKNCRAAKYKENTGGLFDIIPEGDDVYVPWINIDPLNPDLGKYPNYTKAQPLKLSVKAGQTLYLPSLWFHHVSQSHGCIAVNYWYDMVFDIKWAYYKFLEKLTSCI